MGTPNSVCGNCRLSAKTKQSTSTTENRSDRLRNSKDQENETAQFHAEPNVTRKLKRRVQLRAIKIDYLYIYKCAFSAQSEWGIFLVGGGDILLDGNDAVITRTG